VFGQLLPEPQSGYDLTPHVPGMHDALHVAWVSTTYGKTMNTTVRQFPKLIWLLALAGLALNFGTAMLRLSNFFPTPRLIDFGAFYASSWALRLGLSPYALSPTFIEEVMTRTAMPLSPPPIYNPPVWPILTYPFTLLSYSSAAFVWVAVNLAMLAIVTYMLTDIADLHGWELRIVAYAIIVTFGPVFLDLSIGQNSTFLLLMAVVAGWSLRRKVRHTEAIAAAAVALAVGAKLFPLFWSGAFFLLRRWRLFVLTLLLTVGLVITSSLLFPAESLDYLTVQLPARLTSSVELISINDQTLNAWLMRIFRPHAFMLQGISAFEMTEIAWTPAVNLSERFVNLLSYAALLVIAVGTAIVIGRPGRLFPDAALFLWIVVGLLAFPHMERYNHALLLPAMAWLWSRGAFGANVAIVVYFLSGMARLTHFWAVALPSTLAAVFSGFGVMAALLLTGAMLIELKRAAAPSLPAGIPETGEHAPRAVTCAK